MWTEPDGRSNTAEHASAQLPADFTHPKTRSEQKEHVRAANAGSAEMNVRADDVLDVRGNPLSAAGCCRV
jgi:hypothetical protein